jgi:hypothetical protein
MAAMLTNKSRSLVARLIPALLGILVLIGCEDEDSCTNNPPPGLGIVQYYFYGVEAPLSAPTKLDQWMYSVDPTHGGLWNPVTNSPILPPDVTPVDHTTLNPSRSGSTTSNGRRAAASTTSTPGTVVYILDKFGSLLQFNPSSGVVATLNFSQAVSQEIAQRFAVTPDRKFAFITANSAQTGMSTGYVLVADLTSFSIVSTIPLAAGTVAGGIAITPDGSLAYVLTTAYSGGPSVVYVIDVATRAINLTIPVLADSNLSQIAITPDGTEAYLVEGIDGGNFSIQVLDLQSNTLEPPVSIYYGPGKNLTEGYPPSYIALHPDGTRLYLVPVSGGTVQVVSTITKTVSNVIPLAAGAGPVFGAQPTFTPDGIHLALMSGTNLAVFVNTLNDTVESSITLPSPPYGEALNFSLFFAPINP